MGTNSRDYKVSIFVDAMGGDYAPLEIIKGASEAKDILDANISLVGQREKLLALTKENDLDIEGLEIIGSQITVNMDDPPSKVLKDKKDSSLYMAAKLASNTERSAFLSAGNTGATMACSLFNMKRIEGVLRPAIAIIIPLGDKKVLLIDAGANVDSKPIFLKQFAIMGKVYFQNMFDHPKPKIGLINIGEEEKKGNETTIEAYKLLKDTNINFIGNVEGRDIFSGKADIVICDGFIGNIILKSIEGMAKLFFTEIKEALTKSILTKLSALALKKPLYGMKKKFDYEEYGGALLLGVNGVTVISHGSSKAKAIKNAIMVAYQALEKDLTKKIKNEIVQ